MSDFVKRCWALYLILHCWRLVVHSFRLVLTPMFVSRVTRSARLSISIQTMFANFRFSAVSSSSTWTHTSACVSA